IHVRGLIVSDLSIDFSHWNAKNSLAEWLKQQQIPGIFGVDTRQLTKKLRDQGTMFGRLEVEATGFVSIKKTEQPNLVAEVSIKEPIVYSKGSKRIILLDCGVKNNIIRAFLKRNITVIRCPWDYDFSAEPADGILISNGPGDPQNCDVTIENIRKCFSKNIPILGICLGSQILGLAAGTKTFKLKYGHRSHNQPCLESGTRRCYITSQNHGYAIDSETLPQDWREWFVNNNDGTNEGIIHISKPWFGAQFHPEASPGPDDTEFIFDMFLRSMQ
ncbi:MAG: glutamine-hydrolyzing carbamoyl-phosphate synthase small subunit, partial [bacterium]|nr:glutamine-hydrolyzing carbamoyl-phosphate synthase small subunit [bacterium]